MMLPKFLLALTCLSACAIAAPTAIPATTLSPSDGMMEKRAPAVDAALLAALAKLEAQTAAAVASLLAAQTAAILQLLK
ncbi:hypothetical protein XPA_001304 [Xanthoria parietina]